VTHALAERNDLPAWLAAVHPRFASPHLSILFMAAFACALAVSGGFTWLAVVSVLARLIVYAVTIAAWLKGGGRTAGDRLLGFVAILLCTLVASQASAESWTTLIVLAAAGALLFMLAKPRGQRIDHG
jgi:amino acid transporter